ncbi:zinc finger BED domain-containing protein DAYSLEEPER-like [Rosa chinensis]|uniref:zinc finger BED domain-containing protein DAYSLEEPER-like n=1 Tax=Rosa chinensis TaxID=74649 RepID=UPI000D089055|nr:zinc finger BED domain-containing protein DAYSLEEPER-like [Rosa chinensis]
MLVAALKLKNVFGCFSSYDPNFKIVVSPEEWKQVETLLTYMKYLFDAANMVNAHQYPCVNAFFTVVAKIQEELMHAATSEDSFLKLLTTPLLQKFEKYWESCYIVLSIAVVFYPRLKMAMVKKVFYQIYGANAETRMEIVRHALSDLWFQYALPKETPTKDRSVSTIKAEPPTTSQGELPLDRTSITDFEMMVRLWCERQRAPKKMTSELDQYLEEILYQVPIRDFDVLVWWMQNKAKYLTLSKMASDVLAIPLSTLNSDFIFDTAMLKTMDSSLSSSTLEALICDKDWLKK